MDSFEYNKLEVGKTLLETLNSYNVLSESFYKKEKALLIIESSKEEGLLLEAKFKATPNQVTTNHGHIINWDTFNRVWTDYDNYQTEEAVLTEFGIPYQHFLKNVDPKTGMQRHLNNIKRYFEQSRSIKIAEFKNRRDAYSIQFKSGSGMATSLKPSRPTPQDSIDVGNKSRNIPLIDKINKSEVVPGQFYTNITRIPKSTFTSWIRFWDKEVASVRGDKGSLFGRTWKKSFILGYQVTQNLLYEVWYNSLDGTFSLHDIRGIDVTNIRYNTLNEAMRAMFNAVSAEASTDVEVFQNNPTAQSFFRGITGAVDQHIEKMRDIETKGAADFRKMLDDNTSHFTPEMREKFKEYFVREFNTEPAKVIEIAKRYNVIMKKLSGSKDHRIKDLLDEFENFNIDEFERMANALFKTSHLVTTSSSETDLLDIDNDQESEANKEFDKLVDYAHNKFKGNAARNAAFNRKVDGIRSASSAAEEKLAQLKSYLKDKMSEIEQEALDDPIIKRGLDIDGAKPMSKQELHQERLNELNEILGLLGTKNKVESDKIYDRFKRRGEYAKSLRDASILVINTYVKKKDMRPRYLDRVNQIFNEMDRNAQWDKPTEQGFFNQMYAIAGAAKRDGQAADKIGKLYEPDSKRVTENYDADAEDLEIEKMLNDIDNDIRKEHNTQIVRQMRTTASKEATQVKEIKDAVMNDLLEVYTSTRANYSMLPNWLERNIPTLFGPRKDGLTLPQESRGGFWDRILQAVRGTTYKASFVQGFSLKGVVNLEIWYVTEPNPNPGGSKVISSFYVYDVTSMKVVRAYLPYYRHAVALIGSKIASF